MLQKPISTISELLLHFVEDKCKIKSKFILPVFKDIFPLFYSTFVFFMYPLFGLNYYLIISTTSADILEIYITLFAILSTCSIYYTIYITLWNFYHKNTVNVYFLIKWIIDFFRYWIVTDFYLVFTSLFALIGFLLLNILFINSIFTFFGLEQSGIIIYIYTRICMLPYIFYINNIVASYTKGFLSKEKLNIDYSIFSSNMCECFTLSALIRIVLLFGAGYTAKLYINSYVFTSAISESGVEIPPSRSSAEVPCKSNIPKVYYNGADYKELSAKTRRMVEIYSQLPVDFPPEIKVLVWAKIIPNEGVSLTYKLPIPYIDVANVRGPIGLVYGTQVYIHPTVFIQNDVNINDTPVSKIIIGQNSVIGAGCSIIGVGHDLDFKSRSTPISTTASYGQDVIIGKGVMVGTHSVLLPGTVLGDYSIVAANSTISGKVIPAHYTTDGRTMWPNKH